ncbi:MAG: glucosaminidase domain-containing protein [Treponema sp.]|jgi:hypothetical protein|nr:glucosaminidase domain-containing protein [Treponema sp.]
MNLKHSVLILLLFISFSSYLSAQNIIPNPPPPPDSNYPDPASVNNFNGRWAVHLTSEIVSNIHNLMQNSRITIEALQRLDLRLSKPVSIIPVPYNSARSVEGVDEDGVLVRGQRNISPNSTIDVTEKGTLRTIDSEIIVVLFRDMPLKFKRNSQGRYDLFSAELGVETASLYYEGGPPQLLVIDRPPELNDRFDMQAVPYSAPEINQRRNDPPPQPGNQGGGDFSNQFDQSRNINDRGSVTQRGIAGYVTRQNPSVNQETLNSLIETYVREAGSEGINHDIAIAQMLYATNNLSSQRMNTYNYGGLSPEGISWNGSFRDMTEGVRAHIQHLKGYASANPPKTHIVDPRYHLLANIGYLGTVITFDDLYRLWMGNSPNYGNSIDSILNEMYSFSANYR